MRYSLKQLAVFDAIAETKSVSLAAEKLALTQSATSMSLGQLEKNLSKTLFDRQGKQMSLTYWGEWLLPRAKRLLQDAQQIEAGFTSLDTFSGEIRLCASQTPAEHFIPRLISELNAHYPNIHTQFRVKSSHEVIDALLDYQIDLGIIEGQCSNSKIQQCTWQSDELVLVVSQSHPLAEKRKVTYNDLNLCKWVMREKGSGTRTVFDAVTKRYMPNINVVSEFDFVPVIKRLVTDNEYVTCLPRLDVADELRLGSLVELRVEGLDLTRQLSFVWRANVADNPLITCVIDHALAQN